MEMQFSVLLLCVLRITEGFPVSSQLSLAPSQSYTLLVPVSVLGLNGPQVVLVPVNTDWTAQRNQNPAARSEQTHTLTEAEQQHMNNRDLVENQNVNRPFLQLPTVSPDTPTPENPLPQGQFHNTPAPSTAPSPVLPAGVQDITDPLGKVPPSVSAGQSTQTGGTTTSCKHKAEAAHAKANKPVL
ncbi:hypothetical protein HF521_006452 [Silurus meridionalis]|uniref:Uncharacterized protein n=1 Tax=Silurus meridionalis TaxID=175797 RepID=A0A8T0AW13_SILME|nr:hypothetical protein HF521_006452 [Silurus meridionalis]